MGSTLALLYPWVSAEGPAAHLHKSPSGAVELDRSLLESKVRSIFTPYLKQ